MTARASGRTQRIWRDGKMVEWDDCNIHVMAHVVHYGSSVFEGIRCYETPNGGAVFRLKDHMRRLLDSCRIYRIELPYSVDDLVQATLDAVTANELRECYIRPVVVRTGEQMGFDPTGVPVETFIIPWHWGPLHGHGSLDNGIDVCVAPRRARHVPDDGEGGRELPELAAHEARGGERFLRAGYHARRLRIHLRREW
jgi:branched-chain amino acid aminotransferase